MANPGSSTYLSKLDGARVLIIGGTSGIGFGVAEALLEYNASHIFLSSSSSARVTQAVATLKSHSYATGTHIEGIVCDLGQPENLTSNVESLFTQATQDAKLDHVVYTAGDPLQLGNVEDFSLDRMQKAGLVRFFGPLVVAQHLSKAVKQSTSSSFTITTGGLSRRPRPGWSVIMSYLTGLEGMTRALAVDLAPVRVNLVGPGPVDTALWDSHTENEDVNHLKTAIVNATLLKTIGKVEDVVEGYVYFMKDRNTTGSIIYSNGGGLLV